jgi:hypothetical protein
MENQADSLPDLTEKQLNFVLGIQKGLSKSDAYRQAYDCTSMKTDSIWCNASKLASSTKVAQWLTYLKASQITEAVYTKQQHLADMAEAARACKENKAWAAYVKATESLGRCAGHYVDKTEITNTKQQDQDMLDTLEKMLGPKVRKAAEEFLGYTDLH